MKRKILFYATTMVSLLTACQNNWEATNNNTKLLDKPIGHFEETDAKNSDAQCTELETRFQTGIDSGLKVNDKFLTTDFVSSDGKSVYLKTEATIKNMSKTDAYIALELNHVEGIEATSINLNKSCAIVDADNETISKLKCTLDKTDKIPKTQLKYSNCTIRTTTTKPTSKIVSGEYTMKTGNKISVTKVDLSKEGEIVCSTEDGTTGSVGAGKIQIQTYFSKDLLALPDNAAGCFGEVLFSTKKVMLKDGRELEYVRSETLEAPLKNIIKN